MRIITLNDKDSIIKFILENRNGELCYLKKEILEQVFGLGKELLYSFLTELERLNYIRNLGRQADDSIMFFTVASLDTFYEQGGFEKLYSIKNLIDDKLMFEVNQILSDADRKDKKSLLESIKAIVPIISGISTIIKNTGLIDGTGNN